MDTIHTSEVKNFTDELLLWDWDSDTKKYSRTWTRHPRVKTLISKDSEFTLFNLINHECGVVSNGDIFTITVDLHCVSFKYFLKLLGEKQKNYFDNKYHLVAIYSASR